MHVSALVFLIIFLILAVVVSFIRVRQEAMESDKTVEVCLELEGFLERNISVTLSTIDGTALGMLVVLLLGYL